MAIGDTWVQIGQANTAQVMKIPKTSRAVITRKEPGILPGFFLRLSHMCRTQFGVFRHHVGHIFPILKKQITHCNITIKKLAHLVLL